MKRLSMIFLFLTLLMLLGCNNTVKNVDTGEFLPQRCSFSMPLGCDVNEVEVDGNSVSAELSNSASYGIVLQNIDVSTDSCQEYTACFDSNDDKSCKNENLAQVTLDNGGKKKILIVCKSGLSEEAKFAVEFEWYSEKTSATYATSSSGEILVKSG